ncbi:hypothetical protein G3A43_08255 [Paraburkholderia aspalathi]|nr:hypothetical protein [Paraburkholderia aspalathi]MBK3780248.1 hypothetical protein [Paraburkholderia aspalathi]
MKSVRVVAVGLLLGGALMSFGGIDFFRWWTNDTALHTYITAISILSPATATAAGMPLVGGLAYAILCLGVGLFVSATVYTLIEELICNVVYFVGAVPALLVGGIVWLVRTIRNRKYSRAIA